MQFTHVTFARTVNTGNFENFRVEATASIGETDSPEQAGKLLQCYVDQLCGDRLDMLRRPGVRGGVDAGEWPIFEDPRA